MPILQGFSAARRPNWRIICDMRDVRALLYVFNRPNLTDRTLRFRRKAFVKRKNSSEVEETWTYGIASVVTPVHHLRVYDFDDHDIRFDGPSLGKGFATHMLRLLHYILADPNLIPPFPSQWGAPPPSLASNFNVPIAIASILWSDVGLTFYSRCTVGPNRPGWVVKEDANQEVVWKLLPVNNPGDVQTPWSLIYEADFPEIGQTLSVAVRKDLETAIESPGTLFRNDPATPGTLSAVPVRGTYIEPSLTAPPPFGARFTSSRGEETIVLFTAYNRNIGSRILITYIHNLHPDDLPSLLRLLDTIGLKAGRTEGWIWGLVPSSDLAKAWLAASQRDVKIARRAERFGHLLGVAWYGSEEDQEGAELVDGQMWNWC